LIVSVCLPNARHTPELLQIVFKNEAVILDLFLIVNLTNLLILRLLWLCKYLFLKDSTRSSKFEDKERLFEDKERLFEDKERLFEDKERLLEDKERLLEDKERFFDDK